MARITFQHNGETVEIDVSALSLPDGYSLNTPDAPADGFVSQAFADASVADEVKKRMKGYVDRGKAADDPALVKAILDKHGKVGVAAEITSAIDAHRKHWEEEALKPRTRASGQRLLCSRDKAPFYPIAGGAPEKVRLKALSPARTLLFQG